MSASVRAVHDEICAQLKSVAEKWAGIRDSFANSPDDDDREWSKGNGRWANGAARELAELHIDKFESVEDLLAALEAFLRTRPWDGDYPEPSHARTEMLEVLSTIRSRPGPVSKQ